MRWGFGLRVALVRAALGCAALGCTVTPDLFEGLPCPCPAEWTCDEAANVCVRGDRPDAGTDAGLEAGLDAAVDDAAVDGATDAGPSGPPPPLATTCWVRSTGCDWSVDGFTLVDELGTDRFVDGEARNATFSPDACEIYYARRGDIYRVTRTGPRAPFGTEEEVSAFNGAATTVEAPSLSPDGLEAFVASDDGVTLTRAVFRSRRSTPTGAWGPLERMTALSPTEWVTWEPRLAPHGRRLYYAPDNGVQFIHVSERATLGEDFPAPTRVTLVGLEAGYDSNRPSVTHDERLLVGVQQQHLEMATRTGFYATRADWRGAWSRTRPLPATISLASVGDLAVSPDGCEVLVRSQLGTATTLHYVDP